ncbi:peptidase C39 family protein [Pseudomonas cremoricolorata]|uniref:Lipoprotein n=1 Tax=Pseudomonas cremoricolorata TaxID=157783 RepID=A0A089WMA9_9PSED|nr:peptidase C39 family protein [Pseudomonas cremoricolorata]AIR90455.1 lipoprotein [Pseudomonas cremoricolorata]
MPQHSSIARHLRLGLAAALLATTLAGCSSAPPALPKDLAQRVEISGVPFFRGNAYHGGALALATLLSQQGVNVTPGLLDKPLGLPEQIDHLQTAIPRVAREYGLVVYPLDKRLEALLVQVAAGNPVLLRYQEGSSFWSEPRYAVLVGYDRYKKRVLLRAGMDRRRLVDFADFDKAWRQEGSWAVLLQPPRQLPANVDRERWLKGAEDLAHEGQEVAARQAVRRLQE